MTYGGQTVHEGVHVKVTKEYFWTFHFKMTDKMSTPFHRES